MSCNQPIRSYDNIPARKLQRIGYDGLAVVHKRLLKKIVSLSDQNRYIVNSGSVGQPRDNNNNAKYVVIGSLPLFL